MPADLWSVLGEIGNKRAMVVVAGAALLVLGLAGLVLAFAARRRPRPDGTRPGRPLLALVSSLLLAAGALTVLGMGVLIPLGALRLRTHIFDSLPERLMTQEGRLGLLVGDQSARAIRELLNRPRYRDPKRINRHEYKVCSQNGEDGAIAEIFRRIGTTNRFFVEFGAADGAENNTALLVRQGWSGLWMEADTARIKRANATFADYVKGGKLTIIETFITAENIEDLFRQGKVPEEIDLLSIDIDRNDYHVWEKITHYRPRAVVIEYNSGIPPEMSWVVPYDPKGFGHNPFGTGNGASLKALEELGTRKGYKLVGCDLLGVNSFFIREDLTGDHFAAPYTAANHFEPFRKERIDFPQYDPYLLEGGQGKP